MGLDGTFVFFARTSAGRVDISFVSGCDMSVKKLRKSWLAVCVLALVAAFAGSVFAMTGDRSDPTSLAPDRGAVVHHEVINGYDLRVTSAAGNPSAICLLVEGVADGSTFQCQEEGAADQQLGVVLTDRGAGTTLAAGFAPQAKNVRLGGVTGELTPSGLWLIEGDASGVLQVREGERVIWEVDSSASPAIPAPTR